MYNVGNIGINANYVGNVIGWSASSPTTLSIYHLDNGISAIGNISALIEENYIKTVSEMKTQSTYSSFDFENTWEIRENRFPTLKLSNSIYVSEINAEDLQVEIGKEKQIQLSFLPEIADDAVFKYSIDNEEIATVSNEGIVYGLEEGNTTISIKTIDENISKTINLTVIEEKILTGIAVTKLPDNTIYVEGQNFDPTGMIVTATYNDGTTRQVTGYTVTDRDNLTVGKTSVTISYTEGDITKTTTQAITVTEKIEIDLGTYEEQQEGTGKYITKIAPETTIEEVLENIETNGTIEIYKGTEKITDTETNIGTGMTVKITLNNQNVEYTIVVKGDINGDGKAKLSDLSKLKLSIIGTTQLEGAYKEAADLNGDGNVKLSDLSKMKLYLVGTGSL